MFEITWDLPKNPNGPILFFVVKINGTTAKCITYQEYIGNGRKVNMTDANLTARRYSGREDLE